MKTETDQYKMSPSPMDMVIKYFGVIMAAAYIGIGVALITRSGLMNISGTYALPLGILLIAYGLVRAFKVYQRYFQK
jgi:hypothetical protein